MIYYETERLILRNYRPEDVADYHAYMSLATTAEHEDFDPFTLAQCEEAVGARLADDTFWVVERREDGRVIGDVCYRAGEEETYEIAYDFHEAYGGRGYATEACRALVSHLFGVLGVRRVRAGCNEGNAPSWRLLERLGFRREAHCIEDVALKRDEEGRPIYINSYYYALLRREWRG